MVGIATFIIVSLSISTKADTNSRLMTRLLRAAFEGWLAAAIGGRSVETVSVVMGLSCRQAAEAQGA